MYRLYFEHEHYYAIVPTVRKLRTYLCVKSVYKHFSLVLESTYCLNQLFLLTYGDVMKSKRVIPWLVV